MEAMEDDSSEVKDDHNHNYCGSSGGGGGKARAALNSQAAPQPVCPTVPGAEPAKRQGKSLSDSPCGSKFMDSDTGSESSEVSETECSAASNEEKTSLDSSSKFLLNAMAVEDYRKNHWPNLEEAIDRLLIQNLSDHISVSYAQIYGFRLVSPDQAGCNDFPRWFILEVGCFKQQALRFTSPSIHCTFRLWYGSIVRLDHSYVYKCVCQQHSELLYSDLTSKITAHLQQVSTQLQASPPENLIENFNVALTQYLASLQCIVPVFIYLNKFYIESKLNRDLKEDLMKLFADNVAEEHLSKLMPLLIKAHSMPFQVEPSTMASVVKGLYSLRPEWAQLAPALFSSFIPQIHPPAVESQLPDYANHDRKLQMELSMNGFPRGDQSRKRASEDS